MVKIAWKPINGYGPYAYLQESERKGLKVKSNHLGYLGAAGEDGRIPGKDAYVLAVGDYPGGLVSFPFVGDKTKSKLKRGPLDLVNRMEQQSKAGVPAHEITANLPVRRRRKQK